MAVTVLKRPQGYKLTETESTVTSASSSGDALFTTPNAHGFTTGNYIYVKSESESYNGFKYVEVISSTTFKTRDYATASFTPYTRAITLSYWVSSLSHGWQCAHLPIVYKLSSNLWPTNSVSTKRTVSSFSNDNGYVNLNLSGNLDAFNEPSYIEIRGAATESVNGFYQVTDKVSLSDITITLAYDSTYSFTGAQVGLYTNNYNINVRVYCGIPVGHEAESYKPVELAGELLLTPDSDNTVEFSINEIVRSYLLLKNNLTLDTLPNNIDFWTSFYISYTESYDYVPLTTIETFTGTYTIDSFTGYAVQAILPFKNRQSGFLSDYVYSNTYLAQWLVTQEEPIAVVGKYFDLSFIKNFDGILQIVIEKLIAGYAYATDTITYVEQDIGVIRVPITPDATYEYFCVHAEVQELVTVTIEALSLWSNEDYGSGLPSWGGIGTSTPNTNSGASDWIIGELAGDVEVDSTITVSYGLTVGGGSGGTANYDVVFSLQSAGANPGTPPEVSVNFNTEGAKTGTVSLLLDSTQVGSPPYFLKIRKANVVVNENLSLTSISIAQSYLAAVPVTEDICIQILDVCDTTSSPDPDPTGENIRLTEDGDFRILE